MRYLYMKNFCNIGQPPSDLLMRVWENHFFGISVTEMTKPIVHEVQGIIVPITRSIKMTIGWEFE